MPSSELFRLRWKKHDLNLSGVFDQLFCSKDFVDVTLAACDGVCIKVHKVIISAASPYFYKLLVDNPCKHPVIIVNDIDSAVLSSLVEFMYKGETNVLGEHLDALLKYAEKLKIVGLAEGACDRRSSETTVETEDEELIEQNVVPREVEMDVPEPEVVDDNTAGGVAYYCNPEVIKTEVMRDIGPPVFDASLQSESSNGYQDSHAATPSRKRKAKRCPSPMETADLADHVPSPVTVPISNLPNTVPSEEPSALFPVMLNSLENNPVTNDDNEAARSVQSAVLVDPACVIFPAVSSSLESETSNEQVAAASGDTASLSTSSWAASEASDVSEILEAGAQWHHLIEVVYASDTKLFCCRVCNRKLRSKANASKHLETHKPNRRTFPCRLCTCVYLRKEELVRHHKLKHPRSPLNISTYSSVS